MTKAIVVGGSSGIGLATAQQLLQQGARVTVTGRNPEKLQAAKQAGLHTQQVDSTDRQALDAFFAAHGTVDYLVITISGAKGMGNFSSLPLQELREGFEAKFWPQLHTLQSALPYMTENGSVVLVTATSSISKRVGTSGLTAINGALELMVPILAKELKPIRINAVAPGVVDTPWWNFVPDHERQAAFDQFTAGIPIPRAATAAEIADAIVFTLSNKYITGTTIYCDGGFSC